MHGHRSKGRRGCMHTCMHACTQASFSQREASRSPGSAPGRACSRRTAWQAVPAPATALLLGRRAAGMPAVKGGHGVGHGARAQCESIKLAREHLPLPGVPEQLSPKSTRWVAGSTGRAASVSTDGKQAGAAAGCRAHLGLARPGKVDPAVVQLSRLQRGSAGGLRSVQGQRHAAMDRTATAVGVMASATLFCSPALLNAAPAALPTHPETSAGTRVAALRADRVWQPVGHAMQQRRQWVASAPGLNPADELRACLVYALTMNRHSCAAELPKAVQTPTARRHQVLGAQHKTPMTCVSPGGLRSHQWLRRSRCRRWKR